MHRVCFGHRMVIAAVLALALAWCSAGISLAEPVREAETPAASWSLETLWDNVRALWCEGSCSTDPNGATAPASPSSDDDAGAGASIDPNG
ncbi:MAG: hypothetical protein AAF481_14470 [Acidobacteriota bacterium]